MSGLHYIRHSIHILHQTNGPGHLRIQKGTNAGILNLGSYTLSPTRAEYIFTYRRTFISTVRRHRGSQEISAELQFLLGNQKKKTVNLNMYISVYVYTYVTFLKNYDIYVHTILRTSIQQKTNVKGKFQHILNIHDIQKVDIYLIRILLCQINITSKVT